MSTSWRGERRGRGSYRNERAQSTCDGLTERGQADREVRRPSSPGRSATIPVTVQNNLVQGVDHLVLRLTSTSPTRLKIGDGGLRRAADQGRRRAQPVGEVHHHGQRQRPGRGDRPALHRGRQAVRRRRCSSTVKVTEITATVMLVIARRRAAARPRRLPDVHPAQARRRPATPRRTSPERGRAAETPRTAREPRSGPERHVRGGVRDGAPGADDPEQPSDPAPDTGPESADPSGTGEKVDR